MINLDEAELLKITVGAVGAVILILLAVLGFMLRRALSSIDQKLDHLLDSHLDHQSRLVRVETHLGINVPEKSRGQSWRTHD